jgi:hypothetical protein
MPPAFGGNLKQYGASRPISPFAAFQHRLPQVVPPVNSSLRATATIKSRAREEAEKYPRNVPHISAHIVPRGTQHFVGVAQNSEGRRSVPDVEMLPDGNRPANATQFAQHLRLSQRNTQIRKCCVPLCRPASFGSSWGRDE